MTFFKLTAIAAFTAIPVVATVTDTNGQIVPQHVELSVQERGHHIAELSAQERADQFAELSAQEREDQFAELSVQERGHVIAGFDPEERKNQIG